VRRRLPAWILAVGLTWVVGYPLLMTAMEAFGLPGAATLEHWRQFVGRPDEWLAVRHTLWIAFASVALSGLLGVPLAFLFERTEFPGRRLLGALVVLPVALPPLVGVLAFLFLYGDTGILTRGIQMVFGLSKPPWRLRGAGAILLVHAYSMYVYFYLFCRAALARRDMSLSEAAASLGAGRLRTFFRVTLPQLRPALAGAGLLTFMTALASFSAPYIFGGSYRVMTTQIVVSRLNGDVAMAQVESVALAIFAAIALWGVRRVDPGMQLGGGGHGLAPARRRLARPSTRILVASLSWLLAVVLLLPHATVILVSFVPAGTWTNQLLPPVLALSNFTALMEQSRRLQPLLNSLWMATAATAGAVLLGLLAARLGDRLRGAMGRWLEALLVLPWAIPGTVFAIALATTFSVHRPLAGRFVLVGTLWILPLAYLVRSLPLTGRSTLAGLRQLDPALEEAASSLGAGPVRRMRRVVLPLLAPALAAGASLAFITTLGDFVTSILLYTYETRPISIEIYSSLRLQEIGVAAVYGVFLMIVSSLFLYWGRLERHA
jgi:iron(III) transport system permease protein